MSAYAYDDVEPGPDRLLVVARQGIDQLDRECKEAVKLTTLALRDASRERDSLRERDKRSRELLKLAAKRLMEVRGGWPDVIALDAEIQQFLEGK